MTHCLCISVGDYLHCFSSATAPDCSTNAVIRLSPPQESVSARFFRWSCKHHYVRVVERGSRSRYHYQPSAPMPYHCYRSMAQSSPSRRPPAPEHDSSQQTDGLYFSVIRRWQRSIPRVISRVGIVFLVTRWLLSYAPLRIVLARPK